MRTLDTDTIFVDNLFIGARDEVIEIAQPTSRNDTITTTTDVAAYGGVKDVVIKSLPLSSVHPEHSSTRRPEYSHSAQSGIRPVKTNGATSCSVTNPTLTTLSSFPLTRQSLVVIPEFDYFVVKFTWASADVDIKCGFAGNPTSVVYRTRHSTRLRYLTLTTSSWGGIMQKSTAFNSKTVLRWGGERHRWTGRNGIFQRT